MTESNKYTCNVDLNLYQNNIFTSSGPKKSYNTHLAIKKDGVFLLVNSNQTPDLTQNIKKLPIFKNTTKGAPIPFCESDDGVLILSLGKMESAQVLYKTLLELETESSYGNILNLGRELILVPPKRRIAETKRFSKKNLNDFLQSNIPLYHVENIGNILVL